MGERGHSFLVRALTAAVLIAVVAGGVILSRYGFLVLAAAACAGGIYEFLGIAGANKNIGTGANRNIGAGTNSNGASANRNAHAGKSASRSTNALVDVNRDADAAITSAKPLRALPVVIGVTVVVLAFLVTGGYIGARWFVVLIPLVAALFVAELYRKKGSPLADISAALGSLLYVAAPLGLLCALALRGDGYNPWIVLAVVGIVAVNDIFAYIFGVSFGKHRLLERISPKKSWEGFFGGVIFAVGAALLCGRLAGDSIIAGYGIGSNSVLNDSVFGNTGNAAHLLFWGGLGLVIVAGAVFGDLVESMFKRAAGVKDSGNLFPGHGGILDRLDALLLTVPLVYTYLVLFGA